ncbi:MAG: helix-turn-helix domain-containing protein [Chloroflexota bacterium]
MNALHNHFPCPRCGNCDNHAKAGRNLSGSQSYRCGQCSRKFTPQPRPNGYPKAIRDRAIALFLAGASFRAIARELQVNHQTVANWIAAYEAEEAGE